MAPNDFLMRLGLSSPLPRLSWRKTSGTQSARSGSAQREDRDGPPGAQVVSRSVAASLTVAVGHQRCGIVHRGAQGQWWELG